MLVQTKKYKNMTKDILVVVDNDDFQQLIFSVLRKSELTFMPIFASSLKDARYVIQKKKFDTIILDDVIHDIVDGGLGHSLILDIRNSKSSNCTIIMLYEKPIDVFKGKKAGADVALTKNALLDPVRFNEHWELIP